MNPLFIDSSNKKKIFQCLFSDLFFSQCVLNRLCLMELKKLTLQNVLNHILKK